MTACSHLDQVLLLEPSGEIVGCAPCLESGGRWLHLRMCQTCGLIACCDSSPNKHASHHAHDSGRPIIRSVEPGEDWSRCYVDEVAMRLPAQ